jgi:hypothetical protein
MGEGEGMMKLTRQIKEDLAKTVSKAIMAKRRDAAYETLRKELTRIAELQFSGVPVEGMKKYEAYIDFTDTLESSRNYPKEFKESENGRRYKEFGFVPSHRIPLLKPFPCPKDRYCNRVCDRYANRYIKAVRKYMLVYFETVSDYTIILESLKNISTEKQLLDTLPELLEFYTLPEKEKKAGDVKKPDIPERRCRELLQKEIQALI